MLALACGCISDDADDRLSSHLSASLIDCGELEFGIDSCPAGREAALLCMESALASCQRAMLVEHFTTVEGAPIVDYLFVVPAASGCAITRFYDARADGFGSMTLEEYSCTGVMLTEGNTCPFPVATDCQ